MSKQPSTTLSYLVKATGDHYIRQLHYNKQWEKRNPERRKLTVRKYEQRKKEEAKRRQARVDAYLREIGEQEAARKARVAAYMKTLER